MDLKELKRKLPYMWRVQSTTKGATPWAACVAYIDSRDVQDLLDEVVGPENWQSDYKDVKGNLYAGVGICVDGNWIWKWDCGTESNTEAQKGEASDAFKRAAVKWGIGRFLYDLELVWLPTKEQGGKHLPVDDNGNILKSKADVTKFINDRNNKKGTALKDGTREAPEPAVPVQPKNPTPPRTGGLAPERTPISQEETPAASQPVVLPAMSEKGFMLALQTIEDKVKKEGVAEAKAWLDKLQSGRALTEVQLKALKIKLTNDLTPA